MTMQHKAFGLEVKDVTDGGEISGYGSVFGGAPDAYGDVVVPGAFKDSLERHAAEGTMPLMLWGHRESEPPIGNWVEMKEDRKGLFVRGMIDLEDSIGVRVHRSLQRKALRGLSIGYETIDREKDPKNPRINLLKQVDLWEVSPVNFPAQRRATVDTVKALLSDGNLPTLPEFEAFLREAGFSKTQAVAICGKGLAPLLRGEPGNAQDADFWSALRREMGA